MTTLEEIEKAIEELPEDQQRKLIDWVEELKADLWDKQIEEDARSGRLDTLIERAVADHKAGKTIKLPNDCGKP